ncbi:MAG: SEC-C domain-containing protein [Blautia sp.]|nr:SEC-C domain-containing protein [Blautia sp.]
MSELEKDSMENLEEQDSTAQEENENIPEEGTLLWYFYRKYYMLSEEAQQASKNDAQHLNKVNKTLWKGYYEKEKNVYRHILANVTQPLTGTVAELAAQFDVEPMIMSGIIDGMNESLKDPQDVKHLYEDTTVTLEVVPEPLYKNMVLAKADWLYHLPEWDAILSPEVRKGLFAQVKEEKEQYTVKVEVKVGRNDPCPCGSGKKYKYCCGRKA